MPLRKTTEGDDRLHRGREETRAGIRQSSQTHIWRKVSWRAVSAIIAPLSHDLIVECQTKQILSCRCNQQRDCAVGLADCSGWLAARMYVQPVCQTRPVGNTLARSDTGPESSMRFYPCFAQSQTLVFVLGAHAPRDRTRAGCKFVASIRTGQGLARIGRGQQGLLPGHRQDPTGQCTLCVICASNF